jgi:dTDP-4-amino-4,6-dideoxygalactose transaminase
MWPRKTLDIGFYDLFRGLSYALFFVFTPRTASADLERKSETLHADANGRFVCLSVRSGFDTLLRSLNFPVGSEVLFSELTIADMERIASANGLKAVGIELDPESWSINASTLEESITPQTRAIVVAQLFGRRNSLEEIAGIARQYNLLLIEDCAQSFRSPLDQGDSCADVSMFSFGPIKTLTSLGGAIFHMHNRQLVEPFAEQHGKMPRQSNLTFAKRLLKYLLLKCFNHPLVFGTLYRALILFGCDPDLTISGLARGFAGHNFFERIRMRPCASLVRLIESRLCGFDAKKLRKKSSKGRELTSLLLSGIETPAHSKAAKNNTDGYWVYPVLSHHPESLKAELVQHGFDATQRSSFVVIANRHGAHTVGIDFLTRVVFLPLDNQMSSRDIQSLARIVNSHEHRFIDESTQCDNSVEAAMETNDEIASM